MTKQLTLSERLSGEQFKNHLMKVAPEGMSIDRHVAVALEQLRVNLKGGKELAPMSVLNSVYNAGSLGLSFNPAAKEAYLVPFGSMATLIVGYKGLMKLCKNAGMKNMTAKVIYSEDEFVFSEMDGEVTYKYSPTFEENRGKPICVLTIATFENGEKDIKVLPYHKVIKVKNAAKSKNIWKQHEEEMAMKTAIRRHCNQLPQSFTDPKLQQAIKIDEMVDAGKPMYHTPEALKDMEDEGYQDIVDDLNDDGPESTKPEINPDDITELVDAEVVGEQNTPSPNRDQSEETNIEKIMSMVKIDEETLKSTVEAELGFKNINKLSAAKVSQIIDFFIGDVDA